MTHNNFATMIPGANHVIETTHLVHTNSERENTKKEPHLQLGSRFEGQYTGQG